MASRAYYFCLMSLDELTIYDDKIQPMREHRFCRPRSIHEPVAESGSGRVDFGLPAARPVSGQPHHFGRRLAPSGLLRATDNRCVRRHVSAGRGAAIVVTVDDTRSQSMQTHCVPCMPIARAAPRVRSSVTPRVNGPRSLITTVTDLPFWGFVTVTRDPKGRVRCAAAYPLGSNL